MQKDSKFETPDFGRLMIAFQSSGSAEQVARDFEAQKAAMLAFYGPDWRTLHYNSGNEKQMSENFRKMFGHAPGG